MTHGIWKKDSCWPVVLLKWPQTLLSYCMGDRGKKDQPQSLRGSIQPPFRSKIKKIIPRLTFSSPLCVQRIALTPWFIYHHVRLYINKTRLQTMDKWGWILFVTKLLQNLVSVVCLWLYETQGPSRLCSLVQHILSTVKGIKRIAVTRGPRWLHYEESCHASCERDTKWHQERKGDKKRLIFAGDQTRRFTEFHCLTGRRWNAAGWCWRLPHHRFYHDRH